MKKIITATLLSLLISSTQAGPIASVDLTIELKPEQIEENIIANDIWWSPWKTFPAVTLSQEQKKVTIDMTLNGYVQLRDMNFDDSESIHFGFEGLAPGGLVNAADFKFWFTEGKDKDGNDLIVDIGVLKDTTDDTIEGTLTVPGSGNGNFLAGFDFALIPTGDIFMEFKDFHLELIYNGANQWEFTKFMLGVDSENVDLDSVDGTGTGDATPVPVPSSIILLISALIGMIGIRNSNKLKNF